MTRRGTELVGYVDGHPEARATIDRKLAGFQEWGLANPRGGSAPANAHQFIGTVHRFLVREGPLEVSDL